MGVVIVLYLHMAVTCASVSVGPVAATYADLLHDHSCVLELVCDCCFRHCVSWLQIVTVHVCQCSCSLGWASVWLYLPGHYVYVWL